MDTKRVLVFPAGSEIGLEIHNALKYSKDIELFGATSADDHSGLVYEKLIADLPTIDDDGFLGAFRSALAKYGIDYVYPALDSVQLFLLENESEVPAQIVSSPMETVYICRSKRRTYQSLCCGEYCIDFDDTTIVEGKANICAIAVLCCSALTDNVGT